MELENTESKKNLLRLPDVKRRTGLSRSSIYVAVNAATFPKPIQITPRCVAWLEAEVDAWIETRIQKSRA